ncbi:hypothetical protein CRG98_043960 [Punica granatum]|uniref:Extensin-like n=1 Tax=Punica granatum TaxID=22663 RepID=A0A2I0HVD4_PUNGR|nr:hypothetical protein CRG98_043960 [Punica granatum]
MAEGDRVDISEEVNPPVPAHSQPPPAHAPPPPTPAGILPAYSSAPSTHLPPSMSSRAPLPPASLTASASDDQAHITALEGTVNQMATNMAELLALLRGPNRASSSSTPPPGQGPTVDQTPWVPSTQAPENMDTPAPPTLHTSMSYPRRHLFLCRPRPRSMPPLRRRFFQPQARLLRLILKPQSFPPTRLYNLTPAFPTKHRRQ